MHKIPLPPSKQTNKKKQTKNTHKNLGILFMHRTIKHTSVDTPYLLPVRTQAISSLHCNAPILLWLDHMHQVDRAWLTFNLNSISVWYPVFSHSILIVPPISNVNVPIRRPIKLELQINNLIVICFLYVGHFMIRLFQFTQIRRYLVNMTYLCSCFLRHKSDELLQYF